MNLSDRGEALIHYFETCILTAYPDPASPLGRMCTQRGLRMDQYEMIANWRDVSGKPWTIGWGHTGPEVVPGLVWTQERADQAFYQDVGQFEKDVESLVKIHVDQHQFDALVSFAYNVGSDIDTDDIAEGLGDSTLLKKLNAGDYAEAADEFLKWNRAGGKVMLGLKRRRAAERALFLNEDWLQAVKEVV